MRECPRCENCYDDAVLLCPEDGANTRVTLTGTPFLTSRYLIKKRLGRGAMGQVYLAIDQNLQTRQVAIKTVRPDLLNNQDLQQGEAIARFEREARTAASIRHPHVVDVTDFGQSPEGVFYLVMEYVKGETLHHLLRREGTLSVQRTVAILQQVVAGVEAAHDAGILHRDLKPANIFLMHTRKSGKTTGDGFVKVGDFGLAKIMGDVISDSTSGTGPESRGLIGTPDYMAPEQMQPGVKLDARADIYALGTIAYHMLGGRPPFAGDLTQLIMQKMMNDAPPLRTFRTDISGEVERAVMHALVRDHDARPASATEWMDELAAAAGEGEVDEGEARVVVMAPAGTEVYVDDERHGSVGRSGRIILNSIPPGRHVLRVSRAGEGEEERVIEVRPDSSDQIIQAHLQPPRSGSQPGDAYGSAPGSGVQGPSSVSCSGCGATYSSGVKYCGRCGGSSFNTAQSAAAAGLTPFQVPSYAGALQCSRCQTFNPPATKFCGKCGAPVTPTTGFGAPRPVQRVCPRCKTGYPAGARFCGRCGASFPPS
jgi:serine/threonine protein kinase